MEERVFCTVLGAQSVRAIALFDRQCQPQQLPNK